MNSDFSSRFSRRRFLTAGVGTLLTVPAWRAGAEEESLAACLPKERWADVEKKIDAVLAVLSRMVLPFGALGTDADHQPAATSAIITAFLSRGHAPGRGRYGRILEQGLDYVLSVQDKQGVFSTNGMTQDATYHHALSGLMLGEIFGLTGKEQALRIRDAITRALTVSRRSQLSSPKGYGMRYFTKPNDADLSVTGGHFLFYRSAKNAEFDVPEAWITQMLYYVKSCISQDGGFGYQPGNGSSLAMTSVGLLFLAMTGRHTIAEARAAAARVLTFGYQDGVERRDYSLYYASLAMSQMGGESWRNFYPKLVDAQLRQPSTPGGLISTDDGTVGPALASAFYVLSLTPPCQMLPLFQR